MCKINKFQETIISTSWFLSGHIMIEFIIWIIIPHVLHFNEHFNSRHDGFDLAWEPGHPDNFCQQIIVLQGFAALHGLDNGGIHIQLSVSQYFIMNSIRLLASFLLLDRVDLNPLELWSELKIDLKLILFGDYLSNDFPLRHDSWLVLSTLLSNLGWLLIIHHNQNLVLQHRQWNQLLSQLFIFKTSGTLQLIIRQYPISRILQRLYCILTFGLSISHHYSFGVIKGKQNQGLCTANV